MLGGLLALLASATFAISNVSVRRGVITGTVLQGMAITVPIGAPLFLIVAVAIGAFPAIFDFAPLPALYLALAGIVHFIAGRYGNYRAINAMGANLAIPVQQTSLLFSLAIALWLLGESLTPLKLLGIVLVLVGPAMMIQPPRNPAKGLATKDGATKGQATNNPATPFRPRYAEGFTFALLSALAYGVSPVFVRAALRGADPAVSMAGGFLSYAAAAVVIALLLLAPSARRQVFSIEPRAVRWFTLSGVFVCVSQMVRYIALALAPVTVVQPILRLTMVFSVVFSWVINRDHEVFGLRIVAGIVVSLVGALALTVNIEFLLSLLPLPDTVAAAARWKWPN